MKTPPTRCHAGHWFMPDFYNIIVTDYQKPLCLQPLWTLLKLDWADNSPAVALQIQVLIDYCIAVAYLGSRKGRDQA